MANKKYPYKYTQEDWSRTIGYGKVPNQYKKRDDTDGTSTDKQRQRSDRSTTN